MAHIFFQNGHRWLLFYLNPRGQSYIFNYEEYNASIYNKLATIYLQMCSLVKLNIVIPMEELYILSNCDITNICFEAAGTEALSNGYLQHLFCLLG